MLHFSGRRTPTNVFVHGFLVMASGEKMSKSRGTGISPQRYADLGMNPEWLRYYIAAKLNDRVEDLEFNPDDFVARINSDLVGKYVNIASRAAGFVNKHFEGALAYSEGAAKHLAGDARRSLQAAAEERYDARQYGQVVRDAMAIADRINEAFDQAKPWALAKDPARAARRLLARARCAASSCSPSCSRRSCPRRRPPWREPFRSRTRLRLGGRRRAARPRWRVRAPARASIPSRSMRCCRRP